MTKEETHHETMGKIKLLAAGAVDRELRALSLFSTGFIHDAGQWAADAAERWAQAAFEISRLKNPAANGTAYCYRQRAEACRTMVYLYADQSTAAAPAAK